MGNGPKPAVVDVAEGVAGDPPVVADAGGSDLATLVKEAVSDTFNALLGRVASDDAGEAGAEAAESGTGAVVAEPITASGRTAAAREARGPSREATVAEQTRAELARVRKQEAEENENASLRAEVEDMKGQLKALSEKPPEQYNRVTKALWG